MAFESIYSMDGDFARLRDVCALAAEYGALTYLDETHAAGAYGHEGAGVAQALGVTDMLTVVQGSLAKGYGGLGGFIVGPASVIDTVRSHAPAGSSSPRRCLRRSPRPGSPACGTCVARTASATR